MIQYCVNCKKYQDMIFDQWAYFCPVCRDFDNDYELDYYEGVKYRPCMDDPILSEKSLFEQGYTI